MPLSISSRRLRELARIARFIASRYSLRNKCSQQYLANCLEAQQKLQRLIDLEKICTSRGWRTAGRYVRRRLATTLREIQRCTDWQIKSLNENGPDFGTEQEILHDLIALEGEFEGLELDKKSMYLAVITPPIELEGILLGSFKVRLNLKSLSAESVGGYEVIALEPFPAKTNSEVTHPHVRARSLCEGHAHAAINAALRQGRLLDFFQLVLGVLSEYNPSSPYVSLDDWYCVRCRDCDDSFDPADGYVCEYCDAATCDCCHHMCHCCDEVNCHSCSSQCAACEEWACATCVENCVSCFRTVCKSCLENERCPACDREIMEQEEAEEEVESQPLEESPLETSTPLHPLRMGEIAVPA